MMIAQWILLLFLLVCGFCRPIKNEFITIDHTGTSEPITTKTAHSFRPSKSILLSAAQLHQWEWDMTNQGRSRCGFHSLFYNANNTHYDSRLYTANNEEDNEEETSYFHFGLHCQTFSGIRKKHLYDNRYLFPETAPHYEKLFMYYNVEILYNVELRDTSSMLSLEEISWLEENPWFFHIQFHGNSATLTSIPLFQDISLRDKLLKNDNHDNKDVERQSSTPGGSKIITTGRYSNNIGWLYESSQPAEDDVVYLDMAINLHPSDFYSLYINDSFESTASRSDHDHQYYGDYRKLMHSVMQKIEVVIHSINLSFVSQPTKLPLNYTIANLDKELHDNSSTAQLLFEQHDACALKETLDGQVLSNITIASNNHHHQLQPLRIFCGIFTMASNHHKARAIRNTWAKKCSFFIAFSTEDDLSIPAINIAHMGEEKYNNMWQKTRCIWKYIHEYYLHDGFDYFLLGGDDMYYIMENLNAFLNSQEILKEKELQQQRDKEIALIGEEEDEDVADRRMNSSEVAQSIPGSGLYLGRRLRLPGSEDKGRPIFFNSGGPGYLLDKKALQLYIRNADKPFCFPNVLRYAEDAFLSACLFRTKESLPPYETTHDEQGRPRFHIFSPAQSYLFDTSDTTLWLNRFDAFVKNGSDCCSSSSISFHNISESLMYDMDNYLYRCRP